MGASQEMNGCWKAPQAHRPHVGRIKIGIGNAPSSEIRLLRNQALAILSAAQPEWAAAEWPAPIAANVSDDEKKALIKNPSHSNCLYLQPVDVGGWQCSAVGTTERRRIANCYKFPPISPAFCRVTKLFEPRDPLLFQ